MVRHFALLSSGFAYHPAVVRDFDTDIVICAVIVRVHLPEVETSVESSGL